MSDKHVRIFVGSPGDVIVERDSLNTVVNELTRTCAALLPSEDISLELVRWETHSYPSMGRPQGVINAQIGDYDIFVGILWKRFGTPTGRAGSGTEEEFRLAFDRWKKTKRPHILFYFCTAPMAPPKSSEEIRQLALVADFRTEVEKEGLVWEYSGSNRFGDTVRPHLTEVIGMLLNQSERSGDKAETKEAAHGTSDKPLTEPSPDVISRPPSGTEARVDKVPSVVPGALIRISEIGKGDAWYDSRQQLIGVTARIVEVSPLEEGWYQGTVTLDPVPASASLPQRVFAKFRFETIAT